MSTNDQQHPRWVNKQEMAKRLGINLRTVYSKYKRGEILRREVDGQVLWALPDQPRVTRIGSDPKSTTGALNQVKGNRAPEGSGSTDPAPDNIQLALNEHLKTLTEYNHNLTRELIVTREENARLKTQLMHSESENRALMVRLERVEAQLARRAWLNPLSWIKWMAKKLKPYI